jgi:hypothetical protein
MKLWHYLFFGFSLMCGLVTLIMSFQPDDIIPLIKSWSENTEFRVVKKKNVTVIYRGKLGKFYKCLREYRPIHARRLTKPLSGKEETLEIKVEDHTIIHLAVNANEAFQVNLEAQDGTGNWLGNSRGYAINCDLKLLNN